LAAKEEELLKLVEVVMEIMGMVVMEMEREVVVADTVILFLEGEK
jgi:hypothetical protein